MTKWHVLANSSVILAAEILSHAMSPAQRMHTPIWSVQSHKVCDAPFLRCMA